MATKYTFSFTDSAKAVFDLHAYTANGPVSPSNGTLISQAVAQTTTLKLYGKGMQDYGEGVEQNLVYMLENFANSTRPVNSIEGQFWYDNVGGGSPLLGPELYIRNSAANDIAYGPGWDAVILSTGSSQMTGELLLAGFATSGKAAVPLDQLSYHADSDDRHLTTVQNTFLDDLLAGSPPLIDANDVLQLEGITGNVQVQLDDRLKLAGGTMDTNADLTFNDGNIIINSSGSPAAGGDIIMSGGTITGLPLIPTISSEASSKSYVDAQVGAASSGELTGVAFLTETGSPIPTFSPDDTILEFTVTTPGSPPIPTTITVSGVSRVGHAHTAIDTTLDNTFNVSYGTNVQSGIEYIETKKANIASPTFTGAVNISGTLTITSGLTVNTDVLVIGNVVASDPVFPNQLATKSYVDSVSGGAPAVATISVTRTFELSPGGSPPSPYMVQEHLADDNKLSITVNGLKYYASSYGLQQIQYDENATNTLDATFTGLDQTRIYEFAIAIDGGAPTTVSILPGTDTTTHNTLTGAINIAMQAGSPDLVDAIFSVGDLSTEVFVSNTSGVASSIVISDPTGGSPGGSPPTAYLFATDPSPTAIVGAVFLSEEFPTGGSPAPTPDDIEISGDVTAEFIAGKSFTIRGSDDATYGSYDGVYRVHDNGPVYSASPGTTLVPIATVSDSSINTPLLPAYQPIASPFPTVPSPSPFGDVHFTPIGGFDQVLAAIDGLDGDYAETDSAGTTIKPGELTDYVLFLDTIPAAEKIETILLS